MEEKYIEEKLDTAESRLNDHAERIRILEKSQAVTDSRIADLCKTIERQTRGINALSGAIVSALIGFFIFALEQGLFQ